MVLLRCTYVAILDAQRISIFRLDDLKRMEQRHLHAVNVTGTAPLY